MAKLSALLYNSLFVQQVHTAGEMAALASGPHELMVGVRLLFHHKPLKFFTRLPRVSAVSCGLSWYCAMTYFYGAKSGS